MNGLVLGVVLLIGWGGSPLVAMYTASWLQGGEIEPKNALCRTLGTIVWIGATYMYVAGLVAGVGDLPKSMWWPMLLAPAAGLLGVILDSDELTGRQRLLAMAMQLVLAVPAASLFATEANM